MGMLRVAVKIAARGARAVTATKAEWRRLRKAAPQYQEERLLHAVLAVLRRALLMARNRRRKGGAMRKLLLVAVIALAVYYLAMHAKAYMDDQKTLQQYVNTHSTTQPATPGH